MTEDAEIIERMSLEEYAALWGCDPVYDRAPRLRGDGYLFYNFSVEGHDPEFLAKFFPAIERTMLEATEADKGKLEELKIEVERRLACVSGA